MAILFYILIIVVILVLLLPMLFAVSILKLYRQLTDKFRAVQREPHTDDTVSDRRPDAESSRKIFSQDEGEYVDFEEVE